MDLKVNFDLISDHHPMKLEEEIAQKKFRSNKHKLPHHPPTVQFVAHSQRPTPQLLYH
jgi:hypothetical protein